MNEDKKIMLKNKLHEIKYFIRDELTLEELIELKEVLDDSIAAKEQSMSKEFDHDWFDKHIIVDFGDFNNKEDKKKADDLKEKLREKLEEEFRDDKRS